MWRILFEFPRVPSIKDRIFATQCVDCGHNGWHIMSHLETRRCVCNRRMSSKPGPKPKVQDLRVAEVTGPVPHVFELAKKLK